VVPQSQQVIQAQSGQVEGWQQILQAERQQIDVRRKIEMNTANPPQPPTIILPPF